MKEKIGTLFLAAAVIEGCASTPTPTPKPEYLVNCQKGPFDTVKLYTLNEGEEIVIGGITKEGKEDLIIVKPTSSGKFEPIPGYISMNTEHGITLSDNHLLIILDSETSGSQTNVGASITCSENPSPTSSPILT